MEYYKRVELLTIPKTLPLAHRLLVANSHKNWNVRNKKLLLIHKQKYKMQSTTFLIARWFNFLQIFEVDCFQ